MAVKEEEIPEGFKRLREKFPSGIQYWPSNFPRLEDSEWRGIGQYTEFTDKMRDFLKEQGHLFGTFDTVKRIGIIYNFQIWDYPRFNKPDESLEDRGVGLFYSISTKRAFCLSLFRDWLSLLGMDQQSDAIQQAILMEDYKELVYKDERYALLVQFLMDVENRTVMGTPLKRFKEARFFLLNLLKPGVISERDFQEMKKEYLPQLSVSEIIDKTDMLDIIIHFDYLDEFQFTQLRRALLRADKTELIPRLDKFMQDNEKKLRFVNLY